MLKNILASLNPVKLLDSFNSQDFSKAILMLIAMVVPVVIGVRFDVLSIGIFITLGVIFASASDTTGSLRLKVTGMFLSIILAMFVTLIAHFFQVPIWWLLPSLGIFIFGISYLSIYGFRASLISFVGLFALVLSFSTLSQSDLSIYTRLGLIGLGGIWYIGLALLRQVLFPKVATEYHLAETLKLTADYLETRSKLIDKVNNRKRLKKELLDLQTDLTTNHETLRELLISRRRGSGKSSYQARRLVVFRQLVDMLELAMANPVNYAKTDKIFEGNPEKLKGFQNLLLAMRDRLKLIATNLSKPQKIHKSRSMVFCMTKIKEDIILLAQENNEGNDDNFLMLKNYWKYQKNQIDKIKKIEWLLKKKNQLELRHIKNEDRRRFLTKQDYNLSVLVENFNINSTIFRHSLRIALVGMIGYGLGIFFNVQNAYWILLTIIVIMRPNFGLTKTRFKHRTIGTLIGGVLAFLIIMFTRDKTVYAVLSIISFVVAFSMIQRNYKAAAAFITMYVLFIYALIRPSVFEFIQFRVLDTLIGAGLAFVGNLLLWPSWEIKSIDKTLKDTVVANRKYLKEIATYYNRKKKLSTGYKLSRKQAFLKMSDLSSSFQRMNQEPKSQHKNLESVFQIVMLMHTFLSSLASLGTYIMHNPTTPASKDFNSVIKRIENNLLISEKILAQPQNSGESEGSAKRDLSSIYKNDLKNMAKIENLQDFGELDSTKEEAHLVLEQLKWLLSMSQKMPKILEKLNFK